jgi:hypothetical protein
MRKLLGGQHDTEFSETSDNVGPAMLCPQCGAIMTLLTWLPPYEGELELYGKDFGDVVMGPCGGLLITERFADDFKSEGLIGLSGFHPVEIVRVRRKRRGPKPGPPPRYLFVMPDQGNVAVDVEHSRIKSKEPPKCPWCREVGADAIDGFALETGTWHGEDVFRPRGLWGDLTTSERFMRFAERHATSHLTFVPIEKFVWDPSGLYYPRSTQTDPPGRG